MKTILLLLSIWLVSYQMNAKTFPIEKLQQEQEVKDKKATYPGGQEALTEFLKENLRYPKEARRYGKVIIEFTVKKSGKCTDFKIGRAHV